MTLRSPDEFKRIQSSGAVSQEDQQLLVFSADSEDLADNLVEEKDLSQLSDELMKHPSLSIYCIIPLTFFSFSIAISLISINSRSLVGFFFIFFTS